MVQRKQKDKYKKKGLGANEVWISNLKFFKSLYFLRWKACEKIAVFFNFVQNAKHTHCYAKFIVDSISENRFNVT